MTIRLSRRGGTATLTIQDNGAGYRRSNRNAGQGIIGMRERAKIVGGSLQLTGAKEKGTTVRVTARVHDAPG